MGIEADNPGNEYSGTHLSKSTLNVWKKLFFLRNESWKLSIQQISSFLSQNPSTVHQKSDSALKSLSHIQPYHNNGATQYEILSMIRL